MNSRYYFMVGLFAGAGLLMVGSLLLFFGRLDVFMGGAYRVTCRFPEARGIEVGSPVLLVGVEVGKVSGVSLSTDPERGNPEALVVLNIRRDIPLYEGTKAYIRREGIIPSPYVNLVPGAEQARRLATDGTARIDEGLLAPSLEDVISRVDALSANLNKILGDESFRESVRVTMKDLQKLAGDGSRMVISIQTLAESMDTEVKRQGKSVTELTSRLAATAAALSDMVNNVNAIVTGVGEGRGTLGELVKSDKLMSEILNTIEVSQQTLRELHELSRYVRQNPEALFWGRKGGGLGANAKPKLEDDWWRD